MNGNKQRILKYGVIYIIVIIMSLVVCSQFDSFSTNLLFIILTIIAVGSILIWFIPNYTLQLQLVLLAISTGVYGFTSYTVPGIHISILDAFYFSIRLFFFNIDPVVVQNTGRFSSYPLPIEIARWSAATYTVYTLLKIAGKFFGQSFRLLWYQLIGNHYVIYGFHKDTTTLVSNLREENKNVILVVESLLESDRKHLEELGVIVLYHNANDSKRFRKSRLKRAKYYLIFHESDIKNLEELIFLRENFFKDQSMSKFSDLKIYVHLQHQDSIDIFEKYVAKIRTENMRDNYVPVFLKDYVPIRIIDTYKLIAEKFWDDYPLYEGYEERTREASGEALHLTIIGFDEIGTSVLIEALERAHFLNRSKLQATIVDLEASELHQKFHQRYKKIHKISRVNFIDYDVLNENKLDEIPLAQSTHIILSLPNDASNINLGLLLAKKFPGKPIFIKVEKEEMVSQWVHDDQYEFKNIYCFGNKNYILSSKYFINEKMDEAAKKVHEDYYKKRGKGVPSGWEMLEDFNKESNRKQVSHALTKVVMAGFIPVKEVVSGDKEVSLEEFNMHISDKVSELAKIEHQRWNAFHYIRGWDRYDEFTKNRWKDKNKKLHACIIPFEELPNLSEIVLEKGDTPFEEYDYQTIKNLYNTVVEKLGYKIIKK